MKKEKALAVMTTVFIFIGFVGCRDSQTVNSAVSKSMSAVSTNSTKENSIANSQPAKAAQNGYISFAMTSYDDPDNKDGSMTIHVFCYDFTAQKATEVTKVPYTSQYPLAVYSKEDNCVYYSAQSTDKGNRGDQLFSYNLSTKKTVEYTHDLSAINDIIPYKDTIYLSAMKSKTHNVAPILISKTSKIETAVHTGFEDPHVEKIAYDPYAHKVYAACQSDNAEWILMDKFNMSAEETKKKNNYMYEHSNTHISAVDLDRSLSSQIFALKKDLIYRMAAHGNQIYYVSGKDDMESAASETIRQYNIQTKQTTTPIRIGKKGDTADTICYSQDGSKAYFLRQDPRDLVEYDMKTKEIKELFSCDPNQSYINNFMLFA